VVQTVQDHLKTGDRVILVTASFDIYVEKLAKRLGIPNVVCTRAEVRDGILTGRILGKNCHGTEKVERLETLLAPAEWAISILYTDHHSDLPLLKRVSHGVLVNPGARTRALLKRHAFTLFQQK
jgi:HAD superfamily hydrolase (TIGR01490 family)